MTHPGDPPPAGSVAGPGEGPADAAAGHRQQAPAWDPAPPTGSSTPHYAYAPPAAGPHGPADYGVPPWHGGPQTETKAAIALGLAIAAYTPIVPFIGAIAALVLARMARRDILSSGGARTGLGLCTAATVLAWAHLALLVLLVLVVVIPLLAFGAYSGLRS